nr:lipoprotein-releasing ABC transporter permease subunit [Brucella intermedia]
MIKNSSENRPFSRLERLIAWRYLTTKRGGTALSAIAIFSFLGVSLGVATLMIVMAVMNGFREDITARLLGISGHIYVEPVQSRSIEDYNSLTAQIASIPGIRNAIPYVEQTVLVQSYELNTGALLKGISQEDLRNIETLSAALPSEKSASFAEGRSALIGGNLAASLGLSQGDNITVVTAPEGFWKDVFTPTTTSFTVAAILPNDNNEVLSNSLYVDLGSAQHLIGSGKKVDYIELYLQNPNNLDRIRAALRNKLGTSMELVDWKEKNKVLFSALSVERNVMFMILSLIIIVAALNIISGLIMLVKSKTRNIAILRTMGLKRASILRIFMMTGSMIGVAGTLLGAIIGILVCQNIESIGAFLSYMFQSAGSPGESSFFARLPARLDVFETLLIIFFSLLVSLLAPVLPAMRAAGLDPVAGIRS